MKAQPRPRSLAMMLARPPSDRPCRHGFWAMLPTHLLPCWPPETPRAPSDEVASPGRRILKNSATSQPGRSRRGGVPPRSLPTMPARRSPLQSLGLLVPWPQRRDQPSRRYERSLRRRRSTSRQRAPRRGRRALSSAKSADMTASALIPERPERLFLLRRGP